MINPQFSIQTDAAPVGNLLKGVTRVNSRLTIVQNSGPYQVRRPDNLKIITSRTTRRTVTIIRPPSGDTHSNVPIFTTPSGASGYDGVSISTPTLSYVTSTSSYMTYTSSVTTTSSYVTMTSRLTATLSHMEFLYLHYHM